MSSNAITEQREREEALGGGMRAREMAPSLMRDDEPVLARSVAWFALTAFLIGADLLCWTAFKKSLLFYLYWALLRARGATVLEGGPTIWPFWTAAGTLFFTGGLSGLLFHATCEKDELLRRIYGCAGSLLLVVGGVFVVLGMVGTKVLGIPPFLPGIFAGLLALLLLLTFIRNETDEEWRSLAIHALGLVGALAAGVAFVGSNIFSNFLFANLDFMQPSGFLLALLGLGYLWAFVVCRGRGDDLAHLTGLVAAGVGAGIVVLALVRSLLPLSWKTAMPLVPNGLGLAFLGLLYVGLFVLMWVELPMVVMARRELAAFFYSPVAYLVLVVFSFFGWLALWQFIDRALVTDASAGQDLLFEPIVRAFFFGIVPVFVILFIVPALTMRSLSEEKRAGTMEMLLTVPVSEWAVVLSKFLATLAFFLFIWTPWLVFLVAMRVGTQESFDFGPALCFLVILAITGASFVSMGLFFSSLTRNQIISFVLTLAGMFALFFVYFAIFMIRAKSPSSEWIPVLNHISFVDLWFNSLDGKLQPQFLLFPVSATIFWLFLTVKVLEARKWS
jgi:ABC-2 type transport system permease protein